jgi:hypothetical protein
MRAGGLVTLVCLGGLVLTGCGEDSGSPTTAPSAEDASPRAASAPDGPACADVWQDGKALPEGYRGCVEDGEWVKADAMQCDSGQVLVTYADRYYGATGAVVNDTGGALDSSKDYRGALRSCG